jgi:hypothetical protein
MKNALFTTALKRTPAERYLTLFKNVYFITQRNVSSFFSPSASLESREVSVDPRKYSVLFVPATSHHMRAFHECSAGENDGLSRVHVDV